MSESPHTVIEASAAPYVSVVIPTRGEEAKLLPLFDALVRQLLPGDRFEVIVAFDGAEPHGAAAARVAELGARAVTLEMRGGPGAARNRGAAVARGAWLAFTEDDCVPDPDWLERAVARLESEPRLDALVGSTLLPDGRPARRPDGDRPHYLPTNLFVRRELFLRMGGYCEDFFDPARGIYFREDSDFGFALEEQGAKVGVERSARVTHPTEHVRYLDPWRWARRYEMDPLLQTRHPRRFRDRIEVHRLGPFSVRRPFVRACFANVLALLAALTAALFGEAGLAASLAVVAGLALVPVWAKWRFNPIRLPVCALVPPILVLSYIQGLARARSVAPRTGSDRIRP